MDLTLIISVVIIGILYQGDVGSSIVAEDIKCVFEDENLMKKMSFDGTSIEDARIILSSEICRNYVENVCNSKMKNVTKILKISLCFLQFDETCACDNAIKTTDWIDGLLECPTKLLQMELTPKCLRSKLCDTIESNRGLKSLFAEKFTNERGKEFCRAEDKEKILNRERRQGKLATNPSISMRTNARTTTQARGAMTSRRTTLYVVRAATNGAGKAMTTFITRTATTAKVTASTKPIAIRNNNAIITTQVKNAMTSGSSRRTTKTANSYVVRAATNGAGKAMTTFITRTATTAKVTASTKPIAIRNNNAIITTQVKNAMTSGSSRRTTKTATSYVVRAATNGAGKAMTTFITRTATTAKVTASTKPIAIRNTNAISTTQVQKAMTSGSSRRTTKTATSYVVPAATNGAGKAMTTSVFSSVKVNASTNPITSINTNAITTTQAQGAMTNGSSGRTTKTTMSYVVPAVTNGTGKSIERITVTTVKVTASTNSIANISTNAIITTPVKGAMTNGSSGGTIKTTTSYAATNGIGKSLTTYMMSTPNGQGPDNASDILMFLNNIGSKLCTKDLRRIDPNALAKPKVLTAISNNELDLSMRLALTEKVEEMLSKASEFNPQLFASGQNFIFPRRFQTLSNKQLEMIVNVSSYKPNLNLLPVIGSKVAAILLGDPSKMATFKKTLITVPNLDFSQLINKQKITQDFLRPFYGSLLSDKQSRDMYKNYLADSGIDVKSMNLSAKTQLLLSLPDFLSPSVRTDDVQGLNPDASFSILKAIEHSLESLHELDNRDSLDLGSNDQPLPAQYELYDMMQSGNQISDDQKYFLFAKQLLTVIKIKYMKNDACGIIVDNGVYLGTDLTLISTIFDQCSSILASYCKSMLTLPVGFMTPDELQAVDSKLVQQLCLMEICPESAWISDSMTKIIIDVVESLANKRPDILLSPKLTAFLPKLKISTLELLKSSLSIRRICEKMACEMPGNIPAAVIREKMEFCLKNNASLRSLTCTGDSSLFLSMAMENFFQASVTCKQFLFDVDVLQADVINCRARSAIYACAKNLNFTNANDVAQLGSLIDQMSEEEFNTIPKKFLCGFLPMLSGLYEKWDTISEERVSAGFKALEMCPRMMTYQRLMAVDASTECNGLASATVSKVTCPLIYQMSRNVVELTASQLGTMSKEDFVNCVDILGRVDRFNESQWNALAILAKSAYGSDPGKWTADIITSSAGIISGLSPAEISSLVLDQVEAISAIGRNGLWNDEKLSYAFGSVKKYLLKDNLKSLKSPQLRSMGEVICGATVIDISTIPFMVVCESFQNIGKLKVCAENQMAEFLRAVKDPSCLGPSPSSWTPSNIYALGSLIGGLTKDDLSKLSKEQLRFIKPSSVPFISPMQFNGFTAEQLQQLSLDQAARITSSQLKSLDANKKKIIEDKLSSIKTEIALSITGDNGTGKKLGSNALVLVLTILAVVLRGI